jgi:hypothetical protein
MIADTAVLSEIRLTWQGAKKLRARLKANVIANPGAIGSQPSVTLADVAHNLPLIQAFAVLNDVLEQLRDEGRFKCKGRLLGQLMAASTSALPWRDYDLVALGVAKRNDVAHKAKVLKRADCLRFMNAVEAELAAWRVL